MSQKVRLDWEIVAEKCFNFSMISEKALNFPHDGLYVEYKVEVPDEISVDGGTKEGSTNISVTKSIDGVRIWLCSP